MRAGKLNKRITIQKKGATQDEIGQPVPGWVDLAQVWAHIRFMSGSEFNKADAETSIAKASIRIRKRADVHATMQVVSGSTTYKIVAILPDEQGDEYLDLACEVVNG